MKKFLIALILTVAVCGIARADNALDVGNQLSKLPNMKQGVAWSAIDNKFNYLSTIEVASWKNLTFEAGYAGAAENTKDKIVAVVSYPIVKLKDVGVTVPILDLIELNVGAYAGYGRIEKGPDAEFDAGISLSLLEVKF